MFVYNLNYKSLQSKLQEAAKPWTIKEGAIATAHEFERVQSYFGKFKTLLIHQIGYWWECKIFKSNVTGQMTDNWIHAHLGVMG